MGISEDERDDGREKAKSDGINPCIQAIAINYPVGHGGTYRQAHGGEFRFPAIAWLNWQLKGDQEAAKWFTGNSPLLLQRKGWTMEKNF